LIDFFVFGLDDLSIGKSGVFKFPNIIVLVPVCAYNSESVCLMKLAIFGA
jgi:hypothetical protein